MIDTGISPDFVTVEGGTGAAPTVMANSVGTPLCDALIFVKKSLIGIGLRDQIRLITSGKIFSVFHLLKIIALGVDTANSVRGMMMAQGYIHARSCNTGHCCTGTATQNPARGKALAVADKATRVAFFHRATVVNVMELIGAAELDSLHQLEPRHINRRVQGADVKSSTQLRPSIETESIFAASTLPDDWKDDRALANAERW